MSNLEFAGDSGSLSDINATQGEFRDQIAALNDLMRQIAGNAAVSPGDAAQVDPLNAPFTLYVNPYTGSDEFVGGAYNTFEEGVTEAEILASKVKRLEKQRLTCGFTPQRPFKTINRAVIEAAIITSKDWYSFTSRQAQLDCVSIVLSTGVHKLYNGPGEPNTNIASWGLSKNPTTEELEEFNPSSGGGVLLPRGVSLCAADLRKTSIRPEYVPAVTDELVTITDGVANYSNRTAMFKMTGTGYYFGFSIFDNVNEERSHHLLDAFAFATEAELDDFYAKTLSAVGDGADLANNLTVTRTTEFEIVAPIVRGETPTEKWDSTDSASPYIFNVSIRSNYGLGGAFIDGARVGGLKSMVCANFTGVSLQKDMSCWQIYVGGQWVEPTYTEYIAADPDNVRMNPARLSRHISAINDAFIQEVSVFAIGQGIHHFCDTGGEITITNSNSSFGGCAAYSRGYKTFAFPSDSNWAISAIKVPLDLREKSGNVRNIFLGTISEVTSSKITLETALAADPSSISVPAILLRDGYSFKQGTYIWAENLTGDPWYAELPANAWESSAPTEIDIAAAFDGNDPTVENGVNLLIGKRIYIRRLVDTRSPNERRVSIVANNTSSARLPQRNAILQTDPNRTNGSITSLLASTGVETFAVSNAGDHDDPGVTKSTEFTIRRSAPDTSYVQGEFYPAGTVVRANNKHFVASQDISADAASPDHTVWLETFVHTESNYDAEDPIKQEARQLVIDDDTDFQDPFSTDLGINFNNLYTSVQYKSSTDYKGVNAFLQALGFTQEQADAALLPKAEDSRTLDPTSAEDFPTAPSGGAAAGRGNWAIEFRRPSTLRLFAHAWEYTGFLNYSKAVPSAQQDLGPQNAFTYFFTNDSGGRVVPQGTNENGFNITPRGLEDIETGSTLSVENIGSSNIDIVQQTEFENVIIETLEATNVRITGSLETKVAEATTNAAGVVELADLDELRNPPPATNANINTSPRVVTAKGLSFWRTVNNFLSAPKGTPFIYVDPSMDDSANPIDNLEKVLSAPPTSQATKIKRLDIAAEYANAVFSPSVNVEFRVGAGLITENATFETKATLRAWDFNGGDDGEGAYLNDQELGGTGPFLGTEGTTYSNFFNESKQPTFATTFSLSRVSTARNACLFNIRPTRLEFNQEATVVGFAWLGIIESVRNQNIPDSFFPNEYNGYTIPYSEWREGDRDETFNLLTRSFAVRTQPPGSTSPPPEIFGTRVRAAVVFNEEGTLLNCAFGAMQPSSSDLTGGEGVAQNVIQGASGKVCRMDGIRLYGNVKLSSENNTGNIGNENFDLSSLVINATQDLDYRYTGFCRAFYGLKVGTKGEISLALGTSRAPSQSGDFTSDLPYNNITLLAVDNVGVATVANQASSDPSFSGWLAQGPAFEFFVNECRGLVRHGFRNFTQIRVNSNEIGGFEGVFGKYAEDTSTAGGGGSSSLFTYTQGFKFADTSIIDKPQELGLNVDAGDYFRNAGDGNTPRDDTAFDYFTVDGTAGGTSLSAGQVQDNGLPTTSTGVFADLNIKLRGYKKGIEVNDARIVYFDNIF